VIQFSSLVVTVIDPFLWVVDVSPELQKGTKGANRGTSA
jgi:hypothetical protein